MSASGPSGPLVIALCIIGLFELEFQMEYSVDKTI